MNAPHSSRTAPPSLALKELLPALLRRAARTSRRGGWRILLLFVACQAAVTLLVLPLIRWIFRAVLASAGLHAVDASTLGAIFARPGSVAWLWVLVGVALLVVTLQLSLLLLASARLRATATLSWTDLGADAWRLLRKLLRPGSWALLGYLFVILPLSHFGFLSVLHQAIVIPGFVSGELLKSGTGMVALAGVLLLVFVLHLRWALVLPIFALSDASASAALRASWRVTRHSWPALLLTVTTVFLAANVVGFVLIAASTLPTLLSDAVFPAASPFSAALGLATAELLGLFIVGLTTAVLCAVLLELLARAVVLLPGRQWQLPLADGTPATSTPATSSPEAPARRRGPLAVAGVAAALTLLTAVNLPVMAQLHVAPTSLVLAHRGFGAGGVENTLSGLDAAAAAGADLVEMDVMETQDGQFVAMHDANLQRLAGRNVAVGELTLAELTTLQVHDLQGHTDTVPAFRDYVLHAAALQMPLLVEIKLHGQEGPDLVPRLVAEMAELDALEGNIFHSLDLASVEQLKALLPDAYVGYTMALAGHTVPPTSADFIVVEEWSYSPSLRDDAWRRGQELYVWTVNSEAGQRRVLRDEVNGIITDRPDTALALRTELGTERGLAATLRDAIARFVTVL